MSEEGSSKIDPHSTSNVQSFDVQTSKRPTSNVQRPTPDVERCMLLMRIKTTLTDSLLSLAAVLPVE